MKNNEINELNQYIDIHSHILPGIDDGSADFSMSLQMLALAAKRGTRGIIVTPHNKPGRHNAGQKKITSLIEELKQEMEERNISIELYFGNEIYYRSGIREELEEQKCLTMAGSDYILTEFGPMDDFDYIRNGIYNLLAEGYRPILAHAERYEKINGRADRVEDLIEMGCYIQVNAGSIMGNFGFGTKVFTRKLLAKELVHFVATDAHDLGKRSPDLRECASYISKKYGANYMQELCYENPMHIIRNEYI